MDHIATVALRSGVRYPSGLPRRNVPCLSPSQTRSSPLHPSNQLILSQCSATKTLTDTIHPRLALLSQPIIPQPPLLIHVCLDILQSPVSLSAPFPPCPSETNAPMIRRRHHPLTPQERRELITRLLRTTIHDPRHRPRRDVESPARELSNESDQVSATEVGGTRGRFGEVPDLVLR